MAEEALPPCAEDALDEGPAAPPEVGAAAPRAAGAQARVGSKPRGKESRPSFRYGNYRNYYGYRVGASLEDHRLLVLPQEWFARQRCLDVGCNEGLVPLTLTARYGPASFLGLDIDASLVQRAQGNLRRLQRSAAEAAALLASAPPGELGAAETLALAAAVPWLAGVTFRHGNILEASLPPGELDTILCLSVSKWVHLNFGDAGLTALFTSCLAALAPGGRLVLEAQPWKSYKHTFRKQSVRFLILSPLSISRLLQMPADVQAIFKGLQLRPDGFAALLERIGFAEVRQLRQGGSGGFDRPLLMATKPVCETYDAL